MALRTNRPIRRVSEKELTSADKLRIKQKTKGGDNLFLYETDEKEIFDHKKDMVSNLQAEKVKSFLWKKTANNINNIIKNIKWCIKDSYDNPGLFYDEMEEIVNKNFYSNSTMKIIERRSKKNGHC